MREQLIEDINEARNALAEVHGPPRPVEVDSNVLWRLTEHAAESLDPQEQAALTARRAEDEA